MRTFGQLLGAVVIAASLSSVLGASRSPEEYEKVDAFVFEPLHINAIGSLATLRSIGPVLDEKSQLIENRHVPNQKDDLRTLRFDGLLLEAHFPGQNLGRGYVTRIVVTKPQWKLKHGLGVGTTSKQLESVLGEPDERETGRLKYCGDGACGIFHVEKGRVVSATFEIPVD